MRLGFVAVLAAAVWLAASDPEPLFGEGLCGITQTFAHYQGRMISQQTTPAWMPADTPAAWAYASVDVMFTPHYLKVTITGGGDSPETLSCLFECAISKQVEHFSGVTLLALNSSTVLNGTTSPSLFGCLPPNETAHGSSSQILTALLANNCGNASTATGLNGTNIFELTFKPYYSNQAATPASNWIENITFMSSPTGEFNTYNCTNPKCVNQSFNGISWLQCPYDINGEQGTAFLDVILSMRPYPNPTWGLTTPVYLRDGFLFTVLLILLFAIGWVSLFIAAYRPKCLRESDDYSSEEGEGGSDDESDDDGGESGVGGRLSAAQRSATDSDDEDDDEDDDGKASEGSGSEDGSEEDGEGGRLLPGQRPQARQ